MLKFLQKWFVRLGMVIVISILKLRYKITYVGLENITRDKSLKGGKTLILPNHSAVFVDPLLAIIKIWKYFKPRALIVEYMYYEPIVQTVMQLLNGMPIPNFATRVNSVKKKRGEKVFDDVAEAMRQGDNFMIYPAGKLKLGCYEEISGSGVAKIIERVPDVNIILMRIEGLWGSMFSRAITGYSPPLFKTVWEGIKVLIKNGIFFTPRREIKITFEKADSSFPRAQGRTAINDYLENWYNQWDEKEADHLGRMGEKFRTVSYKFYKNEVLEPIVPDVQKHDQSIQDVEIPEDIKQAVLECIAPLVQKRPEEIDPSMQLSSDLGMDSLDLSEILVFLEDRYDVKGLLGADLTSVHKVMALAAGHAQGSVKEDESNVPKEWLKSYDKNPELGEGETVLEAFLAKVKEHPNKIIFGDMRLGTMTYAQVKLKALVLAQYIKKRPDKYVGILMPSTGITLILILACYFANKVPVMINWTVGKSHLQFVKESLNLNQILTSWAFIERLANVDLEPIEDDLVMLEDLKNFITLKEKMKGLALSKRSHKALLKSVGTIDPKDHAVVLFTSGTESNPKGVPLTHENILSDLRGSIPSIQFSDKDVLISFLPPFHSFGFTVTTILPTLLGVRAVYYPDPTDSPRLARALSKWDVSILCGAPSFLRNILKAGEGRPLKLRLCVTGAEKAPQELFQMIENHYPECQLIEGYGITECSPILTLNRPGKKLKGVGQPVKGVDVQILHPETLEKVDIGTHGLICVRGPNIFNGYLNKELSSPFLEIEGESGWYNTGDIGYLDKDNYLTISGRLKRFIKVGGEMISLSAIESALEKQIAPQLSSEEGPPLAVIAEEIPGERPKVSLVTTFDTDLDSVNLALRNEGFSNIVRVSEYIKIDEIPLLGTGKVCYRALKSFFDKSMTI